ncbi:uncharacterized protein LOC126736689 [Anthonomus grandis grandis]|uniref:uncharacterized protein LOC126736689 n=1 Tax=Anthonomus grandis grandis TaxID=2921223 RepID=UPI0021651A9F|nr:uncharacterized protein LOC126736689 [Anthonomus grandis grandis]
MSFGRLLATLVAIVTSVCYVNSICYATIDCNTVDCQNVTSCSEDGQVLIPADNGRCGRCCNSCVFTESFEVDSNPSTCYYTEGDQVKNITCAKDQKCCAILKKCIDALKHCPIRTTGQ